MRNTLALIGLVVVLLVGGGWYLGWYTFTTEPGKDGHRKINVDVNTNEIVDDATKAKQKVGELINKGTNPSTPEPKKVEGQPTSLQQNKEGGLQQNKDGSWTITVPQNYKVIPQ